MDFDDAEAAHSTEAEAEHGLGYLEEYLEAASYGRLDVEVVAHHQWLCAEQPSTHFIGPTGARTGLTRAAGEHAVELADPDVDFSDIDAVMTVFPSTHFGGGNVGGRVTADGSTMPHSRINDDPRSEPSELMYSADWGRVAAHELVHNLGLPTCTHMTPASTSDRRHPRARNGCGSSWA